MSRTLTILQSAISDIQEELEFHITENKDLKDEIESIRSVMNEQAHIDKIKIEHLLDELKSQKETILELRAELFKISFDKNTARSDKGFFGRLIA